MRLSRLNLTRYGKFTNFELDFGAKMPDIPDFHVIYGANEAGKTTVLTAYLDFLFGIEKQTSYNFLHNYQTMQIGGTLEFADGARQFTRLKRDVSGLLDAHLQIVSDNAIAVELFGLQRDDYRLKFSLDADTLEKGGQNILESKGDLGALLFAATAGIADLSQRLNTLRIDNEAFFKKGAHKRDLNVLKAKIADLDDQKTKINTLASQHARLIFNHKQATDLYTKAMQERGDAAAAKEKIAKITDALPRLDTLKKIEELLLPLIDVPDALAGWDQKIPWLQAQEIAFDTELKTTLAAIDALTVEISSIVVDDKALALTDHLEDMAHAKARYDLAERDIPKLRPQVETLSAEIQAILRALEQESDADPEALLLPARIAVALRELTKSWAGVDTAFNTAEYEVSAAKDKCDEEIAKLNAAQATVGVTDAAALSMLEAVVGEIRSAGLNIRCTQTERNLTTLCLNLEEELKTLAPWTGKGADLVALRIPDAAQIEKWNTALEAAKTALADYSRTIDTLTTELHTLRAQDEAIAATTGAISDLEAAQKRAAREAAWLDHRQALSAPSADVFETQLRADDQASDARFRHATEIAAVNATLQSILSKQKQLQRAEELRDAAHKNLDAVRADIATRINNVSPAFLPAWTPAEFSAWAARVAKALEAHKAVREGERMYREANADLVAGTTRLGDKLAKAGIGHNTDDSVDALLLRAQLALDKTALIKAQRDTVDAAKRDIAKRQRALEQAQTKADDWRAQWANACATCWIAMAYPEASIALVAEILSKLDEMRPKLAERASLATRIEKMERDQNAFTESVLEIARQMDEDVREKTALGIAEGLKDRIKKAHDRDIIRTGKHADLQKAGQQQTQYRAKIAESLVQKQKIFDHFGVETLANALLKLADAKTKAALIERRREEQGHIVMALGASSMEEAEITLMHIDLAALSMQKAAAENEFDVADARQREHFLSMSKAQDQIDAIGADEDVALLEERRKTICLEIEDKAKQWLRIQAGIFAAERALQIYREKHRTSMMANASEAFHTISRGAYVKLTTQPDKNGEILVAIGADGKSKDASELSKGTRFQLYLALRIAAYREYASSRQPPSAVPFIADDIMETFDDFRAEEAFRVLSDLANTGQVIYLTHHKHLCSIAQQVCPSVTMHQL